MLSGFVLNIIESDIMTDWAVFGRNTVKNGRIFNGVRYNRSLSL